MEINMRETKCCSWAHEGKLYEIKTILGSYTYKLIISKCFGSKYKVIGERPISLEMKKNYQRIDDELRLIKALMERTK